MKKYRFFAILGSLCLLMTACGNDSSSAESSKAAETTTETETTAGTADVTAAETTTTGTVQTDSTGASAADVTGVSGSEDQPAVTGNGSGSSSGNGSGNSSGTSVSIGTAMQFSTPEEAMNYTVEVWNKQDAAGMLRAIPEKALRALSEETETSVDDLVKYLEQMFGEISDEEDYEPTKVEILGRVKFEEAFRGEKEEESQRAELKDQCEESVRSLAESMGVPESAVKYEILSVRSAAGDEEQSSFVPVFCIDGSWIDVTPQYYAALAAYSYSKSGEDEE